VEIFRIRYEPFTSDSQLHKKTETIQGGTPHDFEYGYNATHWLSSYKKDGGAATIYPYDPNGNRIGPGWGIADAQDRLPSSPPASEYTYQANGELLTKTVGGATTTYTTDLFDNLRTVQRPAPLAPITYGIDGLNRRVSKSVGGVLQRAWAHNGGRIVAEFNEAGVMTARFVYGTRPQVPDSMIDVISGQVYRILTDHLGSVRLVVRLSDGAIVQQLAYDPWGDVKIDTKPGFQPFGFAGGLYDPDTRLVRFGARDYDPAIGRWTAKDPSGFAGGTNLYAYADNDPVNLVDLTGENPVLFMLAGAMRGIGEDILFQMVVQGKPWGCLDGEELAIAGIMGALTGGLGGPIAKGAPRAYSVAAEVSIPMRGVGTRASHFEMANKALLGQMGASPDLAGAMRSLIPNLERDVMGAGELVRGVSPKGWTWHHVVDQPGVMQLVPYQQHAWGSAWQALLHPAGKGGFVQWGWAF
jgi:RHS repeat-associated protein